jgi:DNA-directed RNA polymerase sigma subunit (sigma70/sigma32)
MSDPNAEEYKRRVAAIPRLTREREISLISRIRAGDRAAASELAEPYLRVAADLAEHFASKYQWLGIGEVDFIKEANVGLLLAIDAFAKRRRSNLEQYLRAWIELALERYVEHVRNS